MRNTLLIIFIFLVLGTSLQAQFFSQDKLNGRIINDSTGNRLSWVHIFNETRREWYTSDGRGRFTLPVSGRDTLVFSAIGFLGKVFILEEFNADSVYEIRLSPRYYSIGEVAIRGYQSYESFRQEFKTFRPPVTELDLVRESLYAESAREGKKAFDDKVIRETIENSGQVTMASVPILSREEKFMIRYKERLEEEEVQRQIDKKYNKEIIGSVTGLAENEIIDFMVFCNFSKEFLLSASELDIIYAIKEKYALYRKAGKSGFLFDGSEALPFT